jgi:hypothetical protein
MDNGTSIRKFDGLTTASEGVFRDIGALLPNDNPLARDVGALSGNIETSSANHFCCPPTGPCGDDWNESCKTGVAAFGRKPDDSIFRRNATVCRYAATMDRRFSEVSKL